jgi:uncharacterized protein involved in exopolysaccharide biosynthesis
MSFNLEQIHRLNTQLDEVNARIKQLEDMKAGSSGQQLTSRTPSGTASSGDPMMNDPMVRLTQLRAQLSSLQARYSDKHPDVKKTQNEIQRLERQLGVSDDLGAKERELENLKNRQIELKKSAAPDDAEAKRLGQEIAVLSRQIEEQKRNLRRASTSSVDNELNGQLKKRDDLQIRINEYNRKSQMSSVVQTEYSKLAQESENATKQYNETLAKLTDAKVSKEIDDTQMGERFVIIEEPRVPTKPDKPNRLKIMFGGLFFALFTGVFASVFMENMDHSIKSTEQLQKITKLPVLTILPYVMTDEEKKASSERRVISKVFGHMKWGTSNLVTKDK